MTGGLGESVCQLGVVCCMRWSMVQQFVVARHFLCLVPGFVPRTEGLGANGASLWLSFCWFQFTGVGLQLTSGNDTMPQEGEQCR